MAATREVDQAESPIEQAEKYNTGDIAAGLAESKMAPSSPSASMAEPVNRNSFVIPPNDWMIQPRFYNLFTLSVENGLQRYLFRAVVRAHYPTDERLNDLVDNNAEIKKQVRRLCGILENMRQGGNASRIENPQNSIRQALRQFYSKVYRVPPRTPAAANVARVSLPYEGLPTRIANAIADHYYVDLEVTEEAAVSIMRRLIPKQRERRRWLMDAEFLEHIQTTLVDQERYPLQFLLPHDNFIQESARKALQRPALTAVIGGAFKSMGVGMVKLLQSVGHAFSRLGQGIQARYNALPEGLKAFLRRTAELISIACRSLASAGYRGLVFVATAAKRGVIALANTAVAQKVGRVLLPETIRPFLRDLRDSLGQRQVADGSLPLQTYKNNVTAILGKYPSWWKFSVFRHHHDGRARAVKRQIQNSPDIDEIKNILLRQRQILNTHHDPVQNPLVVTQWNSPRWTEPANRKNAPKENHPSGYLAVVEEALRVPGSVPRP